MKAAFWLEIKKKTLFIAFSENNSAQFKTLLEKHISHTSVNRYKDPHTVPDKAWRSSSAPCDGGRCKILQFSVQPRLKPRHGRRSRLLSTNPL